MRQMPGKLITDFDDRMKSMGHCESHCKVQVILKNRKKNWKHKKNSLIACHRSTSCFYSNFKWYSPFFFRIVQHQSPKRDKICIVSTVDSGMYLFVIQCFLWFTFLFQMILQYLVISTVQWNIERDVIKRISTEASNKPSGEFIWLKFA